MVRIFNCFDSHVHWLETGAKVFQMDLSSLKSQDLASVKGPTLAQGEWVFGAGWDETQWEPATKPHRRSLDQKFPHNPVAFFRADHHALWLNTYALKTLGLFSQNITFDPKKGHILKDESGFPSGVFIDEAMTDVLAKMPKPSSLQMKNWLEKGKKIFCRQGFTAVRNIFSSTEEWHQACLLSEQKDFCFYVESYFRAQNNFDESLKEALKLKSSQNHRLSLKGLKVFLDGALGSQGAFLSQPYRGLQHRGFLLISLPELTEMIEKAWSHGLELAVHAIGDEASHNIALALRRVMKKGLTGRLHIEHAQMLRPETIELLKKAPVVCHFQPCHWLTDRLWIHDKLSTSLQSYLFQWRALEEEGVEFFFGSDSPIEKPSLKSTKEAIEDSAKKGVRALKKPWWLYHCHKDKDSHTFTDITEDGGVQRVVFQGEEVFKNSVKEKESVF